GDERASLLDERSFESEALAVLGLESKFVLLFLRQIVNLAVLEILSLAERHGDPGIVPLELPAPVDGLFPQTAALFLIGSLRLASRLPRSDEFVERLQRFHLALRFRLIVSGPGHAKCQEGRHANQCFLHRIPRRKINSNLVRWLDAGPL